jgi:uncharacterized protein with GYD domain
MSKYLIRATYATEGVKGLLREGGASRRQVVKELVEGSGGTLEAFYFAFGYEDVYAIIDLPDNITAAALGLNISASGSVRVSTTVLLTPEEVDQATKKAVKYRPPGA